MNPTPNVLASEVYWDPDVDHQERGRILACPTYGERSPQVDAAWDKYLYTHRRRAALLVSRQNVANPSPEQEQVVIQWEYWNQSADVIRQDHAAQYVFSLARHKEGLADIFVGEPGSSPVFVAGDLMAAPRIIATFYETADPDGLGNLDYDALYLSIQYGRSAKELSDFADRVEAIHRELVGDESFDAMLAWRLDGALRERTFSRCLAHQAMDEVLDIPRAYPLFEGTILAASLVRWARFWTSAGVGFRARPSVLTIDD